MKQVKIVPEATKGKGWARLTLTDCDSLTGAYGLCIIRPRHQESFLGPRGWTGSESRLHIELEPLEGAAVSLLLSPAIVQHLIQGDNYQFKIYDRAKNLIDECAIRWYGVAYRAPSGNQSPIEITLFDEANHSESQNVTMMGDQEISTSSPAFLDEPLASNEQADQSHLDVLKKLGDNGPVDLNKFRLSGDSFSALFKTSASEKSDSDPWTANSKKNHTSSPYPERKAAVRIKCKGCGHEIIAGWLKCPFCLTTA